MNRKNFLQTVVGTTAAGLWPRMENNNAAEKNKGRILTERMLKYDHLDYPRTTKSAITQFWGRFQDIRFGLEKDECFEVSIDMKILSFTPTRINAFVPCADKEAVLDFFSTRWAYKIITEVLLFDTSGELPEEQRRLFSSGANFERFTATEFYKIFPRRYPASKFNPVCRDGLFHSYIQFHSQTHWRHKCLVCGSKWITKKKLEIS